MARTKRRANGGLLSKASTIPRLDDYPRKGRRGACEAGRMLRNRRIEESKIKVLLLRMIFEENCIPACQSEGLCASRQGEATWVRQLEYGKNRRIE